MRRASSEIVTKAPCRPGSLMVALYASPGEVKEEENEQTFLDVNHVLESDRGQTILTGGFIFANLR